MRSPQYHRVVHDAMNEVNEMGFTQEHGGEWVILTAGHNSITRGPQLFTLSADVADTELVRNRLQCYVIGLMESSQHNEAERQVQNLDLAIILQHYSLFFITIQNV